MKTKNLLLITLLLVLQYHVKSEVALVVDCTKQADGTRLVDPASCTNYYKCVRGVPVRKSCRVGYYFDDVKFECNYAALVDCSRNVRKPTNEDDLAVKDTTVNCTTPCPVVNPVTCLCSNHGGWALPYPYPYPIFPYPYPVWPGQNCSHPIPPPPCNSTIDPDPTPETKCNDTTPPCPTPKSNCPDTPATPSCNTPSPCPTPKSNCPDTPSCNTPSPGPTPECKCPDTPATPSCNSTIPSTNGTSKNPDDAFYVEHPISKRLYYEVKNGKKRLRKCARGQIFDLATSSCKIST